MIKIIFPGWQLLFIFYLKPLKVVLFRLLFFRQFYLREKPSWGKDKL